VSATTGCLNLPVYGYLMMLRLPYSNNSIQYMLCDADNILHVLDVFVCVKL